MSPIVEDKLATAADLISYECPKCGGKFRDLTRYQCEECEKKFWNEITLDPHWFSGKLKDGTPDWNTAKKDKPQFDGNDWSYGVLNIKTMEYERVPIDRDGKRWDYLDYSISMAKRDADEYSGLLRELGNNKHRTAREIKKEEKLKEKMEKEFTKIEKEEKKLEANPTNEM